MSWKRVKVHDCIEFFNGKGIKTELHTGDNPIYGANGIIGSTKESNYSNGIIIGRVGAYCGAVQVEKGTFWATDNTIVAKAKRDNDNQFWYYQFSDLKLNKYAGGAAQPLVTQSVLKEIDIDLPPLETQKRIAEILSAYDDLIENNLKRIKLLEEAAQNIYKEWFVNFRFPGSEHTEFINGLPKGWKRKKVNDVLELNYGKGLKADNRIEGEFPVYGSSGIVGYHNQSLVSNPGIIVGRKGNVGSVFWAFDDFFPIDTVYYVSSSLSLYYLYYCLKGLNYVSSDAAVPGLNRNAAYQLELIVPNESEVLRFEEEIKPYFSMKRNLEIQNQKLKEARDILLPRLMNRTIEVGGS